MKLLSDIFTLKGPKIYLNMTFFLLYKIRYFEKSFVLFFDHTVEVNGNQTVCLPTFFRYSAD